jgi:hypothetical protein
MTKSYHNQKRHGLRGFLQVKMKKDIRAYPRSSVAHLVFEVTSLA